MIYTGHRRGASLFNGAVDVIVLHAGSGESARILQVTLAGGMTTSTAVRTRFCRASTAGTSPTTAVDVQQDTPGRAPSLDCVTTVTSPTRAAGSLLGMEDWNAHGGIVRYHAGPRELIMLLGDVTGYAQAMIRNEAGTADGTAGVKWEE